MKIGIITFWVWDENYGSQLQCFALQQVLKRMGHLPFLIRKTDPLLPPKKFSISMLLCRYICAILHPRRTLDGIRKRRECRSRAFPDFREKFISRSEKKYSSIWDLRKDCPQADAYLTGSDQVWNCFSQDEEGKAWFLDFTPQGAPKISYAASVGKNRSDEESICFMRPLLSQFTAISVREKEGISICAKAGRSDAVQVCDPTLLLTKSDYQRVLNFSRKSNRKGVFVYALNLESKEDFCWDIVEGFAKERLYKLNVVPAQKKSCMVLPRRYFFFPNVLEFLSAIENSACVVTNSFHGVVFSIIMERPFLAILQRGETRTTNNRITGFLSALGLSGRIYEGGDFSAAMDAPIDWASVREKLSVLRERSLEFLRTALAKCEEEIRKGRS